MVSLSERAFQILKPEWTSARKIRILDNGCRKRRPQTQTILKQSFAQSTQVLKRILLSKN